MHEAENALLYDAPPPQDGVRARLVIDAAALKTLLALGAGEPATIAARVLADDDGPAPLAATWAVLEVAGGWYGPVRVVAGTDDDVVALHVAGRLHVPARVKGSVDVH